MTEPIEGELIAGDAKFAIVVSRFNEFVTRRLLDGAVSTFAEHGVETARVSVVWVPGAFEIPLIADRLARSGDFAAVCCLGAVIQGETDHHEHINQQVSRAIMQSGLETGVPVIFGVLTCHNMEQAMDRAGGKVGNKGSEAAQAAMEMADLLRKLRKHGG